MAQQYKLDSHAADMLENFFEIEVPKDWVITDELIKELEQKCGFFTTIETLNDDLDNYHHYLIGT